MARLRYTPAGQLWKDINAVIEAAAPAMDAVGIKRVLHFYAYFGLDRDMAPELNRTLPRYVELAASKLLPGDEGDTPRD
eukprot:scaffold604411_cov33-Prasinocladus_malaysianus.AAC.1